MKPTWFKEMNRSTSILMRSSKASGSSKSCCNLEPEAMKHIMQKKCTFKSCHAIGFPQAPASCFDLHWQTAERRCPISSRVCSQSLRPSFCCNWREMNGRGAAVQTCHQNMTAVQKDDPVIIEHVSFLKRCDIKVSRCY